MSFGVLNVASSIEELEQKAHRSVPSIDDDKPPSAYFQQARSFQAEAKEFRLEGDDEREYMAYCKFSRLVRNLDNHLNIGRYQAEYNGLKMDVNMLSTRMEELRKRIRKLYNSTTESGDAGYAGAATGGGGDPFYSSSSATTTNTTPIDLSAFWKSTSISTSSTQSNANSSSRNFDSDFSLTPSSSNASFSSSRDYFSSPSPATTTTTTTTTNSTSSFGWGSKESRPTTTTTAATTTTTTSAVATTGYDAGSGKSIYERARLTKETDSFALPELPQLQMAPPATDDYDYSASRDRRGADSRHHAAAAAADSSKKGGIFSGWFGGGSSGTASTKKSHPRRAARRNDNDDDNNDDEDDEQDDDFLGHAMGNVMATAAQNEQVQEQIGSALGRAAKSKEFRQSMGDAIASTTDNEFVAQVARNEQFQGMIGEAVSRTAGNKEFQRKVGQTLANAAQNKELREKAKKGALAVGRGLKNAAVKGWDLGLGIYEATREQRAAQNADDDDEYDED